MSLLCHYLCSMMFRAYGTRPQLSGFAPQTKVRGYKMIRACLTADRPTALSETD